jgi:putative SOS response-associated peptidase YedK
LWETWTGPNGEELDTVAIVTTEANDALRPIHHRMPVIVGPEAFDLWLDATAGDVATACTLIRPAPDDLLEACPVSTAVNRVANDHPQLLEPSREAAEPVAKPVRHRAAPDERQGMLF